MFIFESKDMELREVNKVGDVNTTGCRKLRVVHISDTHMLHNDLLPRIPAGDILIHSGDFSSFSAGRYFGNKERDRETIIAEIDSFFEKVPFKHKIFVAGNHEISFTKRSKDYVTSRLRHVHYLQDSAVNIEGISIYGTPWNTKRWTSYARGFAMADGNRVMSRAWDSIPNETDILVTHLPPEGVLDLATKKFRCVNMFRSCQTCAVCGKGHPNFEHWGSKALMNAVLKRVRPKIHMFGHVHEGSGVKVVDGVTFSNAAMKLTETINVFDYYLPE